MHRSYLPQPLRSGQTVEITAQDEIHHLRDVLRHKPSDEISIFNGRGEEARAVIESLSKTKMTVQLKEVRTSEPPSFSLTLACAVPKKSKFETIIEKATEIGAGTIIPMKTQRTEAAWKSHQEEKKSKRFGTVALNAAKQSQRRFVPQIQPLTEFKDVLRKLSPYATIFIPSLEGAPVNILKALAQTELKSDIAILIGPEGDFTPEEYMAAKDTGCIPVSLGPTVLKVETAALVASGCVAQFLYRS